MPARISSCAVGEDPTLRGVSNDGQATRGSFSEAAGLEVETAPVDYRTGSDDTLMRKLPGLKKFLNIVQLYSELGCALDAFRQSLRIGRRLPSETF